MSAARAVPRKPPGPARDHAAGMAPPASPSKGFAAGNTTRAILAAFSPRSFYTDSLDLPSDGNESSSPESSPRAQPKRSSSFHGILKRASSLSLSSNLSESSRLLLDRVGGQETVRMLVDTLLELCHKDQLLARFYENVDMDDLSTKYTAFLICVFDGPCDYEGGGVFNTHRRLVESLGLNEEHYLAFTSHLTKALSLCGISDNTSKHVLKRVAEWKDPVLGLGRFAPKSPKGVPAVVR